VEITVASERSFAVEEVPSGASRRLLLRGAMQLADAPLLQSVIARVSAGPRTRIVLDLGQLTSIDSAGMHCLMAAYETARQHGHELEVPPGLRIRDVRELTEVLESLPLHAATAHGLNGADG
jgi:anti-anti-sigma factor